MGLKRNTYAVCTVGVIGVDCSFFCFSSRAPVGEEINFGGREREREVLEHVP